MKTTSFIYSKWLLSLALLLWQGIALAQAPAISWQKNFGGSDSEGAFSIEQTTDGGYIVAGYSSSNNGDVTGNHGGSDDFWIVKLEANGTVSWQKSLGGSDQDVATSVQQTTEDGGYIVAGYSKSNNGDVTGNYGGYDYWIVKLKPNGTLSWQKSFGGGANDEPYSIQQTTDGGYIVSGASASNVGDVTGNHGGYDYWIVKLDANGNLSWQKCLGGSSWDMANSLQQTTDGGYIVAGKSNSNDGDVMGNHGDYDYWIVKLDANGVISWQKSLGGSGDDEAKAIQQTTDGGYVVAGYSESIDGDVNGNYGNWDYWIVKLDASGNLSWQKSLGGSGYEWANSIQQTIDGGYIVAGFSYSNDGDVTGHNGINVISDYWIVKLDTNSNLSWQKSLGGSENDGAKAIQQTTDGGYIVAGESQSSDGDVTGNHGLNDYWVVKLDSDGVGIEETSMVGGLSVSPNPARDVLNIESDIAKELVVLNVMGELVMRKSIVGKVGLDVSGLPSGVYWVRDVDSGSGEMFVKE